MGIWVSISEHTRFVVFLNVSFVLVASVFSVLHFQSSGIVVKNHLYVEENQQDCKAIHSMSHELKCFHLKSNNPCVTQGYINYLQIFYCNFGKVPSFGLFIMFLWLLVLFYVLGTTASEYFCSLLENLSNLLKLSPTIAGITLLALGNGAPDVFSSLVSFMGNGSSLDIGLNSVLGGTSFVTCAVVGIICFLVHKREIRVKKVDFIRDVVFLLIVLGFLMIIFTTGKVSLFAALGFTSTYIVYVIVVYLSHIPWINCGNCLEPNSSCVVDLTTPILCDMEKQELIIVDETILDETKNLFCCLKSSVSCSKLLYIVELPLYLPRRLTIPDICGEKWSKPITVASSTIAPVFLSALWNLKQKSSLKTTLVVYGIGVLLGIIFGVLAYITTEKSMPPKRFLFIWLTGGFTMSVIWSYITAQELVALLVSLGYIFGISPSILGLTILAWGNSIGDLVTNSTMAMNDGTAGVQIAISGCYAGPIFNILFGLGLSLVGSSWKQYPSLIVIPRDPHLLESLSFLVVGLIWALLVLPSRGMKLDRVLGGGLVALYLISLCFRLLQTIESS